MKLSKYVALHLYNGMEKSFDTFVEIAKSIFREKLQICL